MISSEVERTLVKSPPELWAELSDPAALSRHLGELGEIRIVRTEPERTIEWAAKDTTGTVSIKPSGWGTKVTLSVTREITESTPGPESRSAPAPAPAPAPDSRSQDAPAREPEPDRLPPAVDGPLRAELAAALQPMPATSTSPAESEPALEPRRGFFARLFARRRVSEPLAATDQMPATEPPADAPPDPLAEATARERSQQPPDAFAAVRLALAPETFAAAYLFAAVPGAGGAPEPETPTEPIGDISAQLMQAEEASDEEVTAVLTAVLDRLGAAHHRPFSRA